MLSPRATSPLNVALPASDISRVSAVISLPPSVPLNMMSSSLLPLSIVIFPDEVEIVTAASPAVISSAAEAPLEVILETKAFFKVLSEASCISTWSASAADT